MKFKSPLQLCGVTGAPLYLLPGATRGQDRIVSAELLSTAIYSPSKSMYLATDTRIYAPNVLKVTVKGEDMHMLAFIMPCDFDVAWTDIEAAAAWMDRTLVMGEPIEAGCERISRSIDSGCLATADGAVYITTKPNSQYLFANKLPVTLDAIWIEQQLHEAVLN